MSTITQRKKGWWKAWLLIGIIVAAVAVIFLLANLTNADGEPYIDLVPVEEKYLGLFMWASMSTVNATILLVGAIILGIIIAWLYYNYLRGQKVTTNTPMTGGYNPMPTTPSQPQSGNETVIS